jgi:hypothetical protein
MPMQANDKRSFGEGAAQTRAGRMVGKPTPMATADWTKRRREMLFGIELVSVVKMELLFASTTALNCHQRESASWR